MFCDVSMMTDEVPAMWKIWTDEFLTVVGPWTATPSASLPSSAAQDDADRIGRRTGSIATGGDW